MQKERERERRRIEFLLWIAQEQLDKNNLMAGEFESISYMFAHAPLNPYTQYSMNEIKTQRLQTIKANCLKKKKQFHNSTIKHNLFRCLLKIEKKWTRDKEQIKSDKNWNCVIQYDENDPHLNYYSIKLYYTWWIFLCFSFSFSFFFRYTICVIVKMKSQILHGSRIYISNRSFQKQQFNK